MEEKTDAQNEAQKRKAEELAQRRKERTANDLKVVLKMPEGRRIFWKYMSAAGVFRSSYTGDNGTNFNEGQRNIGLTLFHDVMNTDVKAFMQMQQEHVALIKEEQLAVEKAV